MKKFLAFVFCLLITHPVLSNCTMLEDGSLICSGPSYRETVIDSFSPPFDQILICMFLTGFIETFVFWWFKYRGIKKLFYVFIINLLSNGLMNIALDYCDYKWDISPVSLVGFESGAILFEFLLLGIVFKYSKKLLIDIIFANIISFLLGGYIFIVINKYLKFY